MTLYAVTLATSAALTASTGFIWFDRSDIMDRAPVGRQARAYCLLSAVFTFGLLLGGIL